MIETHQWLVRHAEEFGYKPENVGPASVDLCLGDVQCARRFDALLIGHFPATPFFKCYPNDDGVVRFVGNTFYLCSTVEYILVPSTHCAFINMRSSLARKGLGHKMAGFIDPGFEGQVTLELETSLPVDVSIGERIVQLIYCRLTEETDKPYTGKYLGQRGPTEAYT
jgi:dCTP deaminase